MSAFICGADHFKVLAVFAANSSPRGHTGSRVNPRYLKRL